MPHSILLIDDHALLRQSLVQTLKDSSCQLFDTGNGTEALELLQKNPQIDTVVLDLDVGEEDGLKILEDLRKLSPEIKVLVLSMHTEPLVIQRACNSNIQGYISKDADLKTLKLAVKTVCAGELYFTGMALKILQKGYMTSKNLIGPGSGAEECFSLWQTLSRKEQELFMIFSKGKTSKEAATELGKSLKTVDNQRTSIYSKMNIHDQADLEKAAKALGIL